VVQQLVKEFIAQTHQDRLSRAANFDNNGEDDSESNSNLIEQPSYIDLERHSTEGSKTTSDNISTKSTSKNLVDVRQIAPATTSTDMWLKLTST
jgi:21S rRNA (uridine2791-2'-O)-methyltransferase